MLKLEEVMNDTFEGCCAEVFFTRKHNLVFHCSLCTTILDTFPELVQHIAQPHGLNVKSEFDDIPKTADMPLFVIEEEEEQSNSVFLDSQKLNSGRNGIQLSPKVQTAAATLIKQKAERVAEAVKEECLNFEDFVEMELTKMDELCASVAAASYAHEDEAVVAVESEKLTISKPKESVAKERRNKNQTLNKVDLRMAPLENFEFLNMDETDSETEGEKFALEELMDTEQFYSIVAENLYDESPEDSQNELINTETTDQSKNMCTVQPVFKCKICGNLLGSKRTLNFHLKTQHSGIQYKCRICSITFKAKGNLQQHMRRHIGKKDFSCLQCSKRFITSSELKAHERWHNGDRPFVCNEDGCGECFVTSSLLSQHKRRHSNTRLHQCEICDKSFFASTQLRQHMVVHSVERKHPCGFCDAKFKVRKTLLQHMQLHYNQCQHVCQICYREFKQRPALTSHMKRMHIAKSKDKEAARKT